MVKNLTPAKQRKEWQTRPRWRITRGGRIALGPGKADLLEAIDRTHAISRAAADLGMSYRRAWLLVAEMNACFREPLVSTSRWRGEGASLTSAGRRALILYRRIEIDSLTAARAPIRRLQALLT
ncbi:MAG: winged helix-turn-helix domain-containing protein [Candidatus Polarisedimenticolia bacterium]